MSATFELAGGETSVPQARRAVEQFAAQQQVAQVDDLRLLVSELVTNSVRHARRPVETPIRLQLRHCRRALRVEIHDGGEPWKPQPRQRAVDEPGGWGLVLVDQLADRWGVCCQDGVCVWFELDRLPVCQLAA